MGGHTSGGGNTPNREMSGRRSPGWWGRINSSSWLLVLAGLQVQVRVRVWVQVQVRVQVCLKVHVHLDAGPEVMRLRRVAKAVSWCGAGPGLAGAPPQHPNLRRSSRRSRWWCSRSRVVGASPAGGLGCACLECPVTWAVAPPPWPRGHGAPRAGSGW